MGMKGRVCVVTGASGHTGRAIAEGLTNDGALVFGVISPRRETANDVARSWVPVKADLTNEHAVRECFEDVIRRAGAVEIVVHAAGGFATSGSVSSTTLEVWDRMMDINLRSAFLVVRESLRRMEKNPYGRIVLFGAQSGCEVPAGRVAYGISKSGVHLLARTAALENTNAGLTINAIAPRIIDTPANRTSMPDADHTSWTTTDQILFTLRAWCDPTNHTTGAILQM